MTDPHVTKLSSVPSDSPNIQDNNINAGRDCGRTAQLKLPITNPGSHRCLSEICNIFRYVIKPVLYANETMRKQRL